MENLPELRDIHLPAEDISIFPLAYGWWFLPVFLVALFFLVKLLLWLRRTSKKLYARHLLRKNAGQDNLTAAVNMSELLRRICVSRYPEAVSLSGAEWISFLNDKTRCKLEVNTALLLENAPYVPADSTMFSEQDVKNLRQFCLAFIGDNL